MYTYTYSSCSFDRPCLYKAPEDVLGLCSVAGLSKPAAQPEDDLRPPGAGAAEGGAGKEHQERPADQSRPPVRGEDGAEETSPQDAARGARERCPGGSPQGKPSQIPSYPPSQ